MAFRILFQDKYIVAIDKPAGFHVHPPEDSQHRISNQVNCLFLLKKQLGTYLYPIHRLDRATSGVLLFALDREVAKTMGGLFSTQQLKKVYYCVVRGWTPDEGLIDHPLKSESNSPSLLEARTYFKNIAKIEIPKPVCKYPTSRYSLVRVEPFTGKRHQIRRHLSHLSYPLIGDTIYGNGKHNQFFREEFQTSHLLLKAQAIHFPHPSTGETIIIHSKWSQPWHKIFDLFGICPI